MISACYQLDKSTNIKTGGIYHSRIDYDENSSEYSIDSKKYFLELNYGILEYKINNNLMFTSNSDCSFSVFKINDDIEETTNPFDIQKNYIISNEENQNCCNYIEISEQNKNNILLGMNDGYFHFFDLNKEESFLCQKAHEYGIWSTFILDENTFLTGSEDALLKMWDLRSKSW